MRKILILIFIFSNILVQSQSKKVLFIGNSYSYYIPQIVADLANSVGDNLAFGTSTISSYSLSQHSTNTTTINLIRQGGWNFVVLQEYSQNPSQPLSWVEANVYPYAQYLDSEVNTYNPDAETIFYMTWGRKNGDASRCSSLPEVCTYIGMDNLTRERYMFMAEANHAIVSPVGAVWRYIRQNYPLIELYNPDESHPSEAGYYAAACCFYTTIFRKDPTPLTYNYTINSSDADKIKTAAKLVVFDSLMTWHIGEYDLDTQAPTAPSSLIASNVTGTSFTLSWTASSDNVGVTRYEVFRNGTLITTPVETFASITGLTASTTYTMTVKAKDAAGNTSASSNALNVSTSVSQNELTITGVTALNKVYDRTTAAALNTGSATLVGVLDGDVVTLVSTVATGNFANKNVGTIKTVFTSGFTITGPDAYKYSLILPIATANIAAAGLTISAVTAKNKVYNGTTEATLNVGSATLVGVLGGDMVTLVSTGARGTFANRNVGTGKTVSTSGFTVGGTDASNYILIQPTTTGNITVATLTVSGVIANNKVYDGTNAATLNLGSATLTGIFGTDVVALGSTGVTGTFENVNVGTAKLVTISGFTISGTDSGNYTLTQPTTTASIIGFPLTVTGVTANSRGYNGTTAATLNTGSAALVGVLTGDAVNLVSTGATGIFANKNVGTAKPVLTSGFTLTGADAIKYTLSQPSTTANITVAGLTVSGVIANNKVYNGMTTATLNTASSTLVGVFGSDVVSLVSTSATGTFVNRYVGTAKAVSTSGFTLAGIDSGNYTLTQPTITGNITPANLTVSGITAINKVYDASTAATVNISNIILAGVLGSDIVTLVSTSAIGTFANKNVGTAKTVLISGLTLSGPDSPNYTLTQPSATANISKAGLTISGVAAYNKVYNGTTAATLDIGNAVLSGVLGTDIVSLVFSDASGTFMNKNTGTAKSVSISGITVGGTDSGNYTVTQPATTADITAATLTVSGLTADNKVYDGTIAATLNAENASIAGIFGSDAVTLVSTGAIGVFDNKNVGSHKPVSVSGFSIKGDDAKNYITTQPTLVADITAKTLTITANDLDKDYGTSLTFTGTEYTIEGLIAGDLIPGITLSSPGAKASAIIGIYDILVSEGSNSNYFINYVNGILTVGKALLIATADNKTKTYGSENPVLSITYSGFVNGDDVSMLDEPPVAETDAEINSDAGNYTIEVSGGHDNNYNFKYSTGTFIIEKKDQVIAFEVIPATLRITQEYLLNAKASSGLPVTFECSDPNKVNINGNVLTVLGDGNLTITALQEGDNNWKPAKDITQSIETLPTFDNISSLFTPNSDGINDLWYIPDLEQYGRIQVTVYNRFGQMVYKSDSYHNDWDGTWNGNLLPSAAYYYIIKSTEKGFLKGVVNIVR